MGGPSSKEIQSDETLTKYVDNEITDELLLHFFERTLESDSTLQKRLQDMIAIKSQISSISGSDHLRPTDRVNLEIRNLVKNAALAENDKNPNQNIETDVSDAEILIIKFIDGELNKSELKMVETLISSNDIYRELYEQLVTSKINVSDHLFSEDMEPNSKVKMDIKSLVSQTLEDDDDTPVYASSVPDADYSLRPEPARPPARAKRFTSSLNYYTQRLVPLAAVFVVGLYVSPNLFSSDPTSVSEMDLKLRGSSNEDTMIGSVDFISVIEASSGQNIPVSRLTAASDTSNSISSQIPFYLNLIAPASGEMFLFLETSEQTDTVQTNKGKKEISLGTVDAGQSVRYPATQNLSIDETDTSLRIDLEIRSDYKVFQFTEFVKANRSSLDQENNQ
ncbi:hypothetical protein N9H20_05865 [Planktomarina temperata]|nr:hypothetical protein [Planktomarina temperata]